MKDSKHKTHGSRSLGYIFVAQTEKSNKAYVSGLISLRLEIRIRRFKIDAPKR